jgi:DNA-binding HxlR family transcriptional regulator
MNDSKNLSDFCLVEKTASNKDKWDVCNSCPVKKTATLIGSRWTLLILEELYLKDPIRFNELSNALKPISSRSLSLKLKELLEHGIIEKNIVSSSPPYVEYSLTEKGKEFALLLIKIAKWSFKWDCREKIEQIN